MTGPGFLLDTAAAQSAARAFGEASDSAQGTLRQMESDIDALRGTGYAGAQASALNVAIEGLSGDVKKLAQLLTSLSGVVNSTQTTYNTADTDIAQSIKGIGGVYDRLSG
jgi:WXG100 family type VII secretion target